MKWDLWKQKPGQKVHRRQLWWSTMTQPLLRLRKFTPRESEEVCKGEIQRNTQMIMPDIIWLPKQPLPFDSPHKVTPPVSAVSTAKLSFSCQRSSDAFLEKKGELRTPLPPNVCPCSSSSKTRFALPLSARFFSAFQGKYHLQLPNMKHIKSVAVLAEGKEGPWDHCAQPPLALPS